MIRDPRELFTIKFYGWDDLLILELKVPRAIRGDIRCLVNLAAEYNLVHPDLQTGPLSGRPDPWAGERARKKAEAKAAYPRQRLHPVETICPVLNEDGTIYRDEDGSIPILRHELRYAADDYKPDGQREARRAHGRRS